MPPCYLAQNRAEIFWILNTLPDAARKNVVQKTVSRQFYEFRVSNIALGACPIFL